MIADKDNRLLGGFAQSQLIDVVLNGLHGEHILIEYDIFGVENSAGNEGLVPSNNSDEDPRYCLLNCVAR